MTKVEERAHRPLGFANRVRGPFSFDEIRSKASPIPGGIIFFDLTGVTVLRAASDPTGAGSRVSGRDLG